MVKLSGWKPVPHTWKHGRVHFAKHLQDICTIYFHLPSQQYFLVSASGEWAAVIISKKGTVLVKGSIAFSSYHQPELLLQLQYLWRLIQMAFTGMKTPLCHYFFFTSCFVTCASSALRLLQRYFYMLYTEVEWQGHLDFNCLRVWRWYCQASENVVKQPIEPWNLCVDYKGKVFVCSVLPQKLSKLEGNHVHHVQRLVARMKSHCHLLCCDCHIILSLLSSACMQWGGKPTVPVVPGVLLANPVLLLVFCCFFASLSAWHAL